MAFDPITGILGPLIGGLFGPKGPSAAEIAAQKLSQSQADFINMLIRAYQQILPMYQQMVSGADMPGIVSREFARLGQPFQMPGVLRSRAEQGVRRGTEQERAAMERNIAQRGITGPAAAALLGRVGERGILGQAGLSSDIMAQEAQQTIAQQGELFNRAIQMMGLASGRPELAMSGMQSMLPILAQQAQASQVPGAQWGTILQDIMKYLPKPQQMTTTFPVGTGYELPLGYGGTPTFPSSQIRSPF